MWGFPWWCLPVSWGSWVPSNPVMSMEESTVLLVQPLSVQDSTCYLTSYASEVVLNGKMLDTCSTCRAPRFGKENMEALKQSKTSKADLFLVSSWKVAWHLLSHVDMKSIAPDDCPLATAVLLPSWKDRTSVLLVGCCVTQENASDMLKVGIYWSQICVELLKQLLVVLYWLTPC